MTFLDPLDDPYLRLERRMLIDSILYRERSHKIMVGSISRPYLDLEPTPLNLDIFRDHIPPAYFFWKEKSKLSVVQALSLDPPVFHHIPP